MDIASLRKEYTSQKLDIESVKDSPFQQFEGWFEEARNGEVLEPNAMVLSTLGEGSPSQRTVSMKGFSENGLTFFTNYKSKKSVEISANNRVSVLFPWYQLERQVIINGTATKIDKKESLSYFVSRPFGSRIGAWVSDQSKVISSRSILEMKLEEMKQKFKNIEVPLPDFWRGFRIEPTSFEFWQGRPNRLHDRILYSKQQSKWIKERLSP